MKIYKIYTNTNYKKYILVVVIWLLVVIPVYWYMINHQSQFTFDPDNITHYGNITLYNGQTDFPMMYSFYQWQVKWGGYVTVAALAVIAFVLWRCRGWLIGDWRDG